MLCKGNDSWRRKMGILRGIGLLAAANSAVPVYGQAGDVIDLRTSDRWYADKFSPEAEAEPATGSLAIEDGGKGKIFKNLLPGEPLRILGREYHHGLYMGSLERVTVHLPEKARSFEAVAALYLDWFGQGDRSDTAEFSIELSRSRKLSQVTVRGGAAVPLSVKLNGAREFSMRSSPTNGTQRANAVWADARVVLDNGKSVWLDDLPIEPLASAPDAEPPFSFRLGGIASNQILARSSVTRETRALDGQRTEATTSYRDSRSSLEIRVVSVKYHDFPLVEWTIFLQNVGHEDTPLIEDLKALNFVTQRDGEGEFLLHHFKGSQTTPTDFEPFATELGPGVAKRFESDGRPTSKDLCYFNLAWANRGLIVGLGWPGQWSASFTRDVGRGIRLTAGQAHTHFVLHPGEEARTPLVALEFWHGDWTDGQNVWRRWMLAHNTPAQVRESAASPRLWACADPRGEDLGKVDEAQNLDAIRQDLAAGIKPDLWEMDAGWYVNDGKWVDVGSWIPDPQRFPRGLKPLFDFVHDHGMRMHLWFEPERVSRGSWLWIHHQGWLLQCPEWDANPTEIRDSRLLDLGNAEARGWLVTMLNGYIDQGIDVYRTDFNFDPLPFWQARDALDPNRQGLCENRYVVGYLAYLDALVRHRPGLLIDTCASGGRRLDLETLRRAIPVTRSDYFADPAGAQNLTYGIAFWLPVYGTGTVGHDFYTNRSALGPWPGVGWNLGRPNLDSEKFRRMAEEARTLAPYFYGDYYPLTEYDPSNRVWMGWQFNQPEKGTGLVQIFRRAESAYESALFQLHGLDPEAHYEVIDADSPTRTILGGSELMERGLPVAIRSVSEARIITYRAVAMH